MLRNPLYSGRVYADDTIYTNIYPAIIKVEKFDKVNKMLAVGKRTAAQKKAPVPFILSGKLVCGKCKGQMTGESGTGRNGIHYYYKCHNKKKYHSCDKKNVEKSYIENIVIQATKVFLKNCKELKVIASGVAALFNYTIKDDVVLNSLKTQLKEIDRQLTNMAKAIANGIFSKTTNEKLNSLEQQKEDVEIKIAEHSIKKIQPLRAENVYDFLISFKNVDPTDTMVCKSMIDMFVNRVILYDNEIFIVFNVSEDNTRNIKLENPEDYTEFENEIKQKTTLANSSSLACLKKEQPKPNGSDCSSLVRVKGLEPLLFRTRPLNVRVCRFRHTRIFVYLLFMKAYIIYMFESFLSRLFSKK